MAAVRGMQKVEFFTHIDEIRSMYENGYVVLKILYRELQKKYNWSMSYWSFCKYMKEEIMVSQNDSMRQMDAISHVDSRSSTGVPAGEMTADQLPSENQEAKDPQSDGNEISEEDNKIIDELIKRNPNILGKYR